MCGAKFCHIECLGFVESVPCALTSFKVAEEIFPYDPNFVYYTIFQAIYIPILVCCAHSLESWAHRIQLC